MSAPKDLLLIVVLLATSLALVACGTTAANPSVAGMGGPHEMPVRIEPVLQRDINEATSFIGTLKSRHSSILQPQVAGTIASILVKPGTIVKSGTPLIEIDPSRQKATWNSSLAGSESILADKENAVHTLQSLEASRRSKESNLRFARNQERRYSLLASQGAVSAESADNYQTTRRVAESDLQSIEAQIEAQKSAIAKLDRLVQQSHANVEEQHVQLKYYTINAPFAGIVADIPVRLGEYVNSDSKITVVTENQPLEVYVSVPAEKAAKLRVGMPIQLMDSDDKLIGQASVFFISPNVDDQSQSVLTKALYANSDGKLLSNQTVEAKVVWSKKPELLVPTFAVTHISGQEFVFTAEPCGKGADGKNSGLVAKQNVVELGSIHGNSYVVKKGLKPGDRVVVSGVQNLTDGAPILAQTALSGR